MHLAVDDQLQAGADLITDGEMQRVDFNLGFYDHLTGLKPLPPVRRLGPPAHDQRAAATSASPRWRRRTAWGSSKNTAGCTQ